MIVYIADLAVRRKQWMNQETFKNGVALSQSLPGATAMQTAAYVGLRMRGLSGALASYVGFGLPAFIFMVILSSLYVTSRSLPWVVSLFSGLQVIVVAIVAHAAFSFGRTTIKHYGEVFLASASALALLLSASPFLVIIAAAIAGIFTLKSDRLTSSEQLSKDYPSKVVLMTLLLAVPAGLSYLYTFKPDFFWLAWLMLKIDLFAFGGGFASLPLMLEEIVHTHGWMDSRTFMDGIALGQITPGPIIITAAFVGYLLYGIAGATVAAIAIFTPSFVLLVLAAPFFDKLSQSHLFRSALAGILASFVGLLFAVTVKFSIGVPWDLVRVLLAVVSFCLLLRKVDILYIVVIGAVISIFMF